MPNLFYWETILTSKNCQEIENDVLQVIDAIKAGRYREVNLKQLKGSNGRLLRAKINKKDRIIFSETIYQGKPCLLILDVMRDHRYERLSYLHSNYVNKYIQGIEVSTLDSFINDDSLASDIEIDDPIHLTGSLEESESSGIAWRACVDRNDYPLTLTEEQQELITCSLPAFVQGLAGTGKTCSGFARMLEAYVLEMNEEQTSSSSCKSIKSELKIKNIAYVAPNTQTLLAQTIEEEWEKTTAPLPCTRNISAHFLTFNNLLINSHIVEEKDLIDKSYFLNWLRRQQKTNSFLTKTDLNAYAHEFRVISKYKSIEEYKSSLIFSLEERTLFFNLCQQYITTLSDSNLIDLEYMIPDIKRPIFDFILVDEAQNLSPAQLETLRRLSADNIMFCYDLRQQHHDLYPHLESIYEKMTLERKKPTKITLTKTHRCKGDVANFANQVQDLSDFIGGKSFSRLSLLRLTDINDINNNQAIVHLLSPEEFRAQSPQSAFASNNLDWAVFVPSSHLEEAKKIFHTEMIFEPQFIGGLEFKHVFGYKIFDNKLLKKINKKIPESSEMRSSKFLCSDLSRDDIIETQNILNQLYTGITRSEGSLCLVQEKHPVKNILNWTLPHLQRSSPSISAPLGGGFFREDFTQESSTERHLEVIKKLIQSQHSAQIEKAEKLFNSKLKKELNLSFEEWISTQKQYSGISKKSTVILIADQDNLMTTSKSDISTESDRSSSPHDLATNLFELSLNEGTASSNSPSKLSKNQKKRAKEKAKKLGGGINHSLITQKSRNQKDFLTSLLLSKFSRDDFLLHIRSSTQLVYLLHQNIKTSTELSQTILYFLSENPEQLNILTSVIAKESKLSIDDLNFELLLGSYFQKFNAEIHTVYEVFCHFYHLFNTSYIQPPRLDTNESSLEEIYLTILGSQCLAAVSIIQHYCVSQIFFLSKIKADHSFLKASPNDRIDPSIISFICAFTKENQEAYKTYTNLYEKIIAIKPSNISDEMIDSFSIVSNLITHENPGVFLNFLSDFTKKTFFHVDLLKKIARIKTSDVPFLSRLRSDNQSFCDHEFMETSWLNGLLLYYVKFGESVPELIPSTIYHPYSIPRIFAQSFYDCVSDPTLSLFNNEKLFFFYPSEDDSRAFFKGSILNSKSLTNENHSLRSLYRESIHALKEKNKITREISKEIKKLEIFTKITEANVFSNFSAGAPNRTLSFIDNIIFSHSKESSKIESCAPLNEPTDLVLSMIELNDIEDFKNFFLTKKINMTPSYPGDEEINYQLLNIIQYLAFIGKTDFIAALEEIISEEKRHHFLSYLNATTTTGLSPLILAVLKKHDQTAAYLIRKNCDIPERQIQTNNSKKESVMVLLDCALHLNLLETSKLLLERGASSCHYESSEISFDTKFSENHFDELTLNRDLLMIESGLLSVSEIKELCIRKKPHLFKAEESDEKASEDTLEITTSPALINPSISEFVQYFKINNEFRKHIRTLNQLKWINDRSPDEVMDYLITALEKKIDIELIKKILMSYRKKFSSLDLTPYEESMFEIYQLLAKNNYDLLESARTEPFIEKCEKTYQRILSIFFQRVKDCLDTINSSKEEKNSIDHSELFKQIIEKELIDIESFILKYKKESMRTFRFIQVVTILSYSDNDHLFSNYLSHLPECKKMDCNEPLNIPSISINKSISDLLGSSKKLSFLKYFDGYRAPSLESRSALLWTNPRATKKDPKRSTTKTVKKPDFI